MTSLAATSKGISYAEFFVGECLATKEKRSRKSFEAVIILAKTMHLRTRDGLRDRKSSQTKTIDNVKFHDLNGQGSMMEHPNAGFPSSPTVSLRCRNGNVRFRNGTNAIDGDNDNVDFGFYKTTKAGQS